MNSEESLARAREVVNSIMGMREDKPSLVSQIACDVGAEIIEGVIPPGRDLNTVDLSRRYVTSRTPIREALLLLEHERLVEIPPRRRPRAMSLDIEEVREIYRTRAALLEFIAIDVARLATDAGIAQLREAADAMGRGAEANDFNAVFWANVQFHEINTCLSRNRTVKRIIDSLLLRTLPLRRLSLSQPGRLAESIEDHRRLVSAYLDRDANLAAAILRSNHSSALKRLESVLSTETGADRWRDAASR